MNFGMEDTRVNLSFSSMLGPFHYFQHFLNIFKHQSTVTFSAFRRKREFRVEISQNDTIVIDFRSTRANFS